MPQVRIDKEGYPSWGVPHIVLTYTVPIFSPGAQHFGGAIDVTREHTYISTEISTGVNVAVSARHNVSANSTVNTNTSTITTTTTLGGFSIVGAEFTPLNGLENVGAAYLYQRSQGGWDEILVLKPTTIRANAYFGQSVAISQPYSSLRSDITALVGAPGLAQVYVYLYNGSDWRLQTVFQPSEVSVNRDLSAL